MTPMEWIVTGWLGFVGIACIGIFVYLCRKARDDDDDDMGGM